MSQPPRFFTTRQLADSLGVSESSVKRWVDDGVIVADRTAGGHRRIPMAAAMRFIRRKGARPVRPDLLAPGSAPAFGAVDSAATDSLHGALVADDAGAARAVICGRYLSGASVSLIGDGLLRPVLEKIGELWKDDERGIMIEHRAVETCVQVLSEVASWMPEPDRDAAVAIAAAGPDDPYLLPPLLGSLTLRECGLRVRNLGPNTPMATMRTAVAEYGAALLSASVSVAPIPGAARAVEWLELAESAEAMGCRVLLGGRCVENMPEQVRRRVRVAGSMSELSAYAAGLLQGTGLGPKGKRNSAGRRV